MPLDVLRTEGLDLAPLRMTSIEQIARIRRENHMLETRDAAVTELLQAANDDAVARLLEEANNS